MAGIKITHTHTHTTNFMLSQILKCLYLNTDGIEALGGDSHCDGYIFDDIKKQKIFETSWQQQKYSHYFTWTVSASAE